MVARGHPPAQLAADQRECDRNARTGHDPAWRARNVAWYVSTSPLWLLFPVFDPGNEKPGWVGAPPTAGRDDYLRAYRECMTARGYDAQLTGTAR